MKYLIILALIIFSINSFSQTAKQLDEKYGSDKIKFDSKISDYDRPKLVKEDSNFIVYAYHVLEGSNNLKTIFNAEFPNLYLFFDKNTKLLSRIELTKLGVFQNLCFENTTIEVQNLKLDFEKRIGKSKSDEKDYEITHTWTGKKIKLILSAKTDVTSDKGDNLVAECLIKISIQKK